MRTRDAYTLVELVMVVAIIAILATLVVPMAMNMLGDNDLDVASDMIRMAWAEARGRAIDKSTAFKFAVESGSGVFQVAPDSLEYWEGAPSQLASSLQDDGDVLVGALPKGVIFNTSGGAATPSGSWSGFITFLPEGTAQEDAVITFGTAEGSGHTSLRLRGLTGAVTSESPAAAEGGVP